MALVGAIGLAVCRVVPAGRQVREQLGPVSRWVAFAVAATATVGSLTFSEYFDYAPCTLCWYQRVAMFSLAVVLLVGAVRRDRNVRYYAVPLAGIGLCISAYHYLVEWFPRLETSACDAVTPCSAYWFREFGFVTLAFMAGSGFLAVLALMLFTVEKPAETPTAGAPHAGPVEEKVPHDATT